MKRRHMNGLCQAESQARASYKSWVVRWERVYMVGQNVLYPSCVRSYPRLGIVVT